MIRIVTDKPAYLPKPRDLLHENRSSKTGKLNSDECSIAGEEMIPHFKKYQQMLANENLKKIFITYIMDQFITLTNRSSIPAQIILDYEDLDCPCVLYQGGKTDLPLLRNKNGEADYNLWYHCMSSTSSNIIILGSDTDIWVYGMAFKDCGWLCNKTVYVERLLNVEYVNINSISEAALNHPKLNIISFPLLTLATIYVLTGGDYISGFFKTSKQTFMKVFIDNIEHICSDRVFVETHQETIMGIEGYKVLKISTEAWVKLVCSVYLMKHKTLFNSESLASLYASLRATPLSQEKTQLLKWLAYDKIFAFTDLSHWHDFTRRRCFYHSSGSKDHECLLTPTYGALNYHMLRSEQV